MSPATGGKLLIDTALPSASSPARRTPIFGHEVPHRVSQFNLSHSQRGVNHSDVSFQSFDMRSSAHAVPPRGRARSTNGTGQLLFRRGHISGIAGYKRIRLMSVFGT